MEGMIDVTSMNEPDPSWVFVDAAGHEHRWAGDWQRSTLPTCKVVIDHECDDDCPDEYHGPRSHYECIQCGARVEPKTCPSPCRRFVPGLDLGRQRPFVRELRVEEPAKGFWRVLVNGKVEYEGDDPAAVQRTVDHFNALIDSGVM